MFKKKKSRFYVVCESQNEETIFFQTNNEKEVLSSKEKFSQRETVKCFSIYELNENENSYSLKFQRNNCKKNKIGFV